MFDVKAYGAVGNGRVDDTAAVAKALADLQGQGKGVLYFPAGDYKLTSPLVVTNTPCTVRGDGIEQSVLAFQDCGGFIFDNSSRTSQPRPAVNVADMSLTTNMVGAHTAITFSGPGTSDLGKQLTCWNAQIRGSDYTKCWQVGVDLTNGGMTDFRGVYFLGHTTDYTLMQYAVLLRSASTDVKLIGCYFYWVDVGVGLSGGQGSSNAGEGIVVAFSHFAPVGYGVWSKENTGNYIVVNNNHISAHVRGVVLGTGGVNGSNHSHVTDNLIFKDASSTEEFVGVHLFGSRCAVVGNEVMYRGKAGATNGVVLEADVSYCRVIGNNFADQDTGVWAKANTVHNIIAHNTGLNNARLTLDAGTQNLVSDNLGGPAA